MSRSISVAEKPKSSEANSYEEKPITQEKEIRKSVEITEDSYVEKRVMQEKEIPKSTKITEDSFVEKPIEEQKETQKSVKTKGEIKLSSSSKIVKEKEENKVSIENAVKNLKISDAIKSLTEKVPGLKEKVQDLIQRNAFNDIPKSKPDDKAQIKLTDKGKIKVKKTELDLLLEPEEDEKMIVKSDGTRVANKILNKAIEVNDIKDTIKLDKRRTVSFSDILEKEPPDSVITPASSPPKRLVSDIPEKELVDSAIPLAPSPPKPSILSDHAYFVPSVDKREENDLKFEGELRTDLEKLTIKDNDKENKRKEHKSHRESPVIDVVGVVDEELKPVIEPKPVFPMRSFEEDNLLVWDILQNGADHEDIDYLKSAFESLQLLGSEVVQDLNWSYHPGILFCTIIFIFRWNANLIKISMFFTAHKMHIGYHK